MAEPTAQPTNAAALEADMARLDTMLRQLKVQYDMFFAGSLKRQPLELRGEAEKIIRRYANASIQKYAQRFHLGTLISRYNSLAELWGKTMRSREEGEWHGAPAPEASEPQETLVARCRIRDAKEQAEQLKPLYERYVAARRACGGDTSELPFDKFLRGIARQTRTLQERGECGEIELRVVVADHRVELRARARR
jgi:hypothetical protein